MTGGAGQDDDDDVNTLINAIRTVARQDEAAVASLPADAAPLLSEAVRGRITDQILQAQAQVQAQAGDRQQRTEPRAAGADNVRAPAQDALGLRRERARSRKSFVLTVGGLGVAAAAAAVFMIGMRPPVEGGPLPMYGISASGGVAELRGGKPDATETDATTTAPPQRLRAESELRIICRPDSAITGPVAVRAFFVQGNDVDEVKPAVQLAATGAAELRLRGADLIGRHHGHGGLRVVVGRPGAVRGVDARAVSGANEKVGSESGREPGHSDRRWLTVPLDLEGP